MKSQGEKSSLVGQRVMRRRQRVEVVLVARVQGGQLVQGGQHDHLEGSTWVSTL